MTPPVGATSSVVRKEAQQEIQDDNPIGLIVMWAGDLSNPPAGWALCDGNNGTPDLTNKFIVGAGNQYSTGDTGGQNSVVLSEAQLPSHVHSSGGYSTSTDGAHTHTYTPSIQDLGHSSGNFATNKSGSTTTTSTSTDGAHSHGSMSNSSGQTGGDGAHENRPEFHGIGFIQRVSS